MAKPVLHTKHSAWSTLKHLLKANLMWTVICTLFLTWVGISATVYQLETGIKDSNIHTLQDGLWWGIVTFLTVGYGDKYPVTVSGRLIASLLMVVGVVTMSIVTAKISTYFLEQALAKGRKTVDTDKLKNHFVICGWKDDMEELLLHILSCNPDLEPKDIVLVAPLSEILVDSIKQHPELNEVQLVIADFIHESNLRRAAPQRARRILIVADQTPKPDGKLPSESEVDARTIMAAMTLSQIARGTLVAAEIYDPKMDHYLKIANVSEVIYTREYSRLILGNATAGTGIANVLFEILSPNTPVKIITMQIPEALVGKTYGEIKRAWTGYHGSSLLLGVLENTGNSDSVRHRALRNAQKTANMGELVSNLKRVKSLRFNSPVFAPPNDYVVHEGSLAITLDHQLEGAETHGQPGEKTA
jgi:voltage-gated potassium channel